MIIQIILSVALDMVIRKKRIAAPFNKGGGKYKRK